jgi:hypothetical protein
MKLVSAAAFVASQFALSLPGSRASSGSSASVRMSDRIDFSAKLYTLET